MASGDTKTEAMLNALGNGGSADEFRGCCNTKTQQYILDAIDRVQNVEDEVEELKNNPDVVDIVDTYADLEAYDTSTLTDKDIIRVLSDSTHSGNSTYYRWNATTSQFDFVGEIAGGGGSVKELTSADYNWPVSDPQGIAYWLLDDGVYYAVSGVRFYYGSASSEWNAVERVFIVEADGTSYKTATSLEPHQIKYYRNDKNTGNNSNGYPYTVLTTNSVTQTTGTSTTNVMSQNAVTAELYPQYSAHSKGVIGIGNNSITNYGDSKIGIGNVTLGNISAYAVAINGGDSGATVNAISGLGIWAGNGGTVTGHSGVAIGSGASVSASGGVAIGRSSSATLQGEFNIGSSESGYGYNNTNYRLLSGLYDGQTDHDAVTVGQVNSVIDAINTALSTNIPHIGA